MFTAHIPPWKNQRRSSVSVRMAMKQAGQLLARPAGKQRTCLNHTTGTPTEFTSRFKTSRCFPSVQTTIGHANSHPGLFMLPLLYSSSPNPHLAFLLPLSTESKYSPIQSATKQPMKTEDLTLCQVNPPTLFFFARVSALKQHPQCIVFTGLLWDNDLRKPACFSFSNTKEKFHWNT